LATSTRSTSFTVSLRRELRAVVTPLREHRPSQRIPVNRPRRSFFLVEDEALIRMMLVDMLEELGHAVVAEAGRIEDALRLAHDPGFDIAILDINLGGPTSTPVAEILAKRSVPFVFASGYGEDDIPGGFKNRPTLRKPFQLDGLERAIHAALAEYEN
jgi:DNA-binding response OmpR family regulator